jgi:hypothetical protein
MGKIEIYAEGNIILKSIGQMEIEWMWVERNLPFFIVLMSADSIMTDHLG